MAGTAPIIGLVAGETSGDRLGATLIAEIRERLPQARFVGMTGPAMRAASCHSLADINELSVMGLTEILAHLPRLLSLRRRLISGLLNEHPDIVIGIDSPDFTLGLERRCRAAGLRTAHYVSPSVWAWRPRRVRTVARAAELVLCLLPFEPDCYRGVDVRAEFVGHPLAGELSPRPAAAARETLGLRAAGPVLAVLPGSRGSELTRLLPPFLGAAAELSRMRPDLQVVIPVARPELRPLVETACGEYPGLSPLLLDGQAHEAVSAADAVLVASGTATLETLLLDRPMVVAYRMAPLSAWLLLRAGLLRTPYFALPNLIAGRGIVPELAQREASVDKITASLAPLLDGGKAREAQLAAFDQVREALGRGSARHAADLIIEWMERDGSKGA
ncbi:MAG: lipid-A-disaccharide synthase [Gammaproteobacteria bacterium]